MTNNNETFERHIFSATTIIYTKVIDDNIEHEYQASGFFYEEMSPKESGGQDPQWYIIDKHWLITNRHVVLPKIDEKEYIPDEFTFHIRRIKDSIEWEAITLTKEELRSKLKLHSNSNIDVALIDITDYIKSYCENESKEGTLSSLMLSGSISNLKLPENSKLTIDVTTDVIVASYPKGFYDEYNKFPIIKSGIIASAWGFRFKGDPIFQIDAQLFPGSSGGLVISKPTNIAMIDGKMAYSKTKEFAFLGIYSGEYYWTDTIRLQNGEIINQHRSYGLGNVWYSYLVPEIINQGINYKSIK